MDKKPKSRSIRALAAPVSPRALETFVGIVLAVWVIGRVVLVHSVIADTNWAIWNEPYPLLLAVVVGCLVAALACKGLDLELPGIVGLCCLLFAVLAVWSKTGDARPIVLTLFLVAAKGMNLARLLRFFGISALAAIATAALAVAVFSALGKIDDLGGQLPVVRAFSEPSMIACLLFGALCAGFINLKDDMRLRVALFVACLLCAVAAFTLLHARRCGLLMAVLTVCILAESRFRDSLGAFFAKRSTSWLIAALPVALLCLTNDAFSFYAIGDQMSGFALAVPNFGYAAVACFATLYVRAVLLGVGGNRRFAVSVVFMLYALYLLFEPFPLNLEFDCALLLLCAGLGRGVLSSDSASGQEIERA